jgi:hypothetical protein
MTPADLPTARPRDQGIITCATIKRLLCRNVVYKPVIAAAAVKVLICRPTSEQRVVTAEAKKNVICIEDLQHIIRVIPVKF